MQKMFRLYWLNGQTEVVKGTDVTDAFTNRGYGQGAVHALDFYNTIENEQTPLSHYWDTSEKKWVPVTPVFNPA